MVLWFLAYDLQTQQLIRPVALMLAVVAGALASPLFMTTEIALYQAVRHES
jgi:hypothetical protein